MCGIFGVTSPGKAPKSMVRVLARHARQRGKDSSGLLYFQDNVYKISRADYDIKKLLFQTAWGKTGFIVGHSRLITNGLADNQPVEREGAVLLHNGIIVNTQEVWKTCKTVRQLEIDSEAILMEIKRYQHTFGYRGCL